jgi:hypothetical protein
MPFLHNTHQKGIPQCQPKSRKLFVLFATACKFLLSAIVSAHSLNPCRLSTGGLLVNLSALGYAPRTYKQGKKIRFQGSSSIETFRLHKQKLSNANTAISSAIRLLNKYP